MLESIRRGQKWLTGILVALVGGVFVFFMGLGGPMQQGAPSQGTVVELGSIRLDQRDFLRVRAQQSDAYRDQLGDQFNSKIARDFLAAIRDWMGADGEGRAFLDAATEVKTVWIPWGA